MLCYTEIFSDDLVFNVSRFSRLCSQTRFITKQKEIDVKSVYLNLGRDKVVALYLFRDIYKGALFQSRKKELLAIFQKVRNVINEALRLLLQP